MHYNISELMPCATVLNNCSELIPHSTVPQYPPLPRANTIRYSIELYALWSLNTPPLLRANTRTTASNYTLYGA
ncbi:hypothetical protein BDZ91DRAFT_735703 [Kalaharituber pfeilii]|nr:hypothetical protein BDZ91DRAFT_735703 [Kalaharituber pfeilii]